MLGCLQDRNSTAALIRLLDDAEVRVRMAAARALGDLGDPAALERLARLVDGDDEKVRLEALLSVDRIIAENVTDDLRKMRLRVARKALLDDSWPVRLAACDLLLNNPDESSLPALIRGIRDESPEREGSRRRVRSALRRTLAALTGEDFPSFRPEDWEAWWERVQAGFRLPEQGLAAIAPEQGARFCGLPVESDVVLFLLDISGSMNQPVTGDPDGPTRIFIALRETRRCVEALEDGTRFNIVLFNDKIYPFMNEPVEKSAVSVESASRFMRTVRPDGGTDLFGALDHVLGLGRVNPDETPVFGDLDTLVLLTDGMPSRGTVLIPEEILHQVSHANRPYRIAIHTVNAGGTEETFLKRLAVENFGESCSLRN
ncbi:MAG: HEAT repeat domain-containing protein [Planctomycetota bacterium]